MAQVKIEIPDSELDNRSKGEIKKWKNKYSQMEHKYFSLMNEFDALKIKATKAMEAYSKIEELAIYLKEHFELYDRDDNRYS